MPDGARRDFFELMQELVLRSGDMSIAELGRRIGYSSQSVHLALVGPRIPSWRLTEVIAKGIVGTDRIESIRESWQEAVAEHRRESAARVESAPKRIAAVSTPRTPLPDAQHRGEAVFSDPGLTSTEKKVLVAWMVSDTREPVARALGIGLNSLDSHLRRIRAKYAAVGRSAPSKASLIARALQDGLVDLHDL